MKALKSCVADKPALTTTGIRETESSVTASITADRTVPTAQHAPLFLPTASRHCVCVAFPHRLKPSSAAMPTDRTNQHDRNRLGRSASFGAAWFPSRVSITQEYWWRMTSVARHVINKTAWNKVQRFSILKTFMTGFYSKPSEFRSIHRRCYDSNKSLSYDRVKYNEGYVWNCFRAWLLVV